MSINCALPKASANIGHSLSKRLHQKKFSPIQDSFECVTNLWGTTYCPNNPSAAGCCYAELEFGDTLPHTFVTHLFFCYRFAMKNSRCGRIAHSRLSHGLISSCFFDFRRLSRLGCLFFPVRFVLSAGWRLSLFFSFSACR